MCRRHILTSHFLPLIDICGDVTLSFSGVTPGLKFCCFSDTESTVLFGALLSVLVVYPTALTSGGSVSRILDTLLDFRSVPDGTVGLVSAPGEPGRGMLCQRQLDMLQISASALL